MRATAAVRSMTADAGCAEPETDPSGRWLTSGILRTILITLGQPATLPALADALITVLPFSSVVDYQQSIADADAGLYGDGIVQAAGEHGARQEWAHVAEFSERLQSLVAEYFSPAGADPAASPKYGFRWVLTPVDLHPLGDR